VDESATATLIRPEREPQPLDTRVEAGVRRWWRAYVTDVRNDANARAVADSRTDRDAVVVLLTAAVCLTLIEYLARRDGTGLVDARTQPGQLTAWAIVSIAAYVIGPLLVARRVLHRPLRDLGVRADGIAAHWRAYAALYAIALPVLVGASFGAAFQAKYPFYDLGIDESFWPHLYGWWLLYALQFVALEFFFRGFLLHGLAPRLGWLSIFVMVVPYNMLHYGKPMPEAFVAILGGVVLGSLSLRTRSIWFGAALHIAIALTMDALALWHAGRLL
jgi:membrane protease YdiL (CAAX protease family)